MKMLFRTPKSHAGDITVHEWSANVCGLEYLESMGREMSSTVNPKSHFALIKFAFKLRDAVGVRN